MLQFQERHQGSGYAITPTVLNQLIRQQTQQQCSIKIMRFRQFNDNSRKSLLALVASSLKIVTDKKQDYMPIMLIIEGIV